MKITEEFPKLLKIIYDNCDRYLTTYMFFADKSITINNGYPSVRRDDESVKIEVEHDLTTLVKCYAYLLSTGFITETTTQNKEHKNPTLTYKGINFIEEYINPYL